jgi:hypothetical protein
MMNEWVHVKGDAEFRLLKAMGAQTETRNYVKLPTGWKVGGQRAGTNGVERHGKVMPTGDKWIKGGDSIRLAIGKPCKYPDSQKVKVLEAVKLAFNKGDMKMVLTRSKIEAAVMATTKLTKGQVTGQITALIEDGWFRRAGPEQMKS